MIKLIVALVAASPVVFAVAGTLTDKIRDRITRSHGATDKRPQ